MIECDAIMFNSTPATVMIVLDLERLTAAVTLHPTALRDLELPQQDAAVTGSKV